MTALPDVLSPPAGPGAHPSPAVGRGWKAREAPRWLAHGNAGGARPPTLVSSGRHPRAQSFPHCPGSGSVEERVECLEKSVLGLTLARLHFLLCNLQERMRKPALVSRVGASPFYPGSSGPLRAEAWSCPRCVPRTMGKSVRLSVATDGTALGPVPSTGAASAAVQTPGSRPRPPHRVPLTRF